MGEGREIEKVGQQVSEREMRREFASGYTAK